MYNRIVLRQFSLCFVYERSDLESATQTKATQTKAEFSSAIAMMDKIGGWVEENWVGSRFAASMWI